MEFTYRPIAAWPGKLRTARKRALFKAGYAKTLAKLDTELRHLRASHVVLQVGLTDDEIRLDGKPRAGARVRHPGVILSFESKHGPLSYPCDTYDRFEANLHAIALALENLRAVDRYGVTVRGEQYKGWQALPAPAHPMTRMQAYSILYSLSGLPNGTISGSEDEKRAYREAALKHHPDRNHGSEESTANFKKLQEAADVLGI